MTGGFVQWVNVFFSYSNHQRLLCHSSHFAVVISPSNITLTIQKLQSHFHNPTRVTLKNVTPIFCFFNKRQGKSGHLNSCESAGNFWAVPEHKQICGQAFSSRFQRPEASPSLIRSSLVFPPQLRSKESSLPSPAFDNYFFNKMYFPVFRVSLLFYSAMPTHSETHRPLKMCPLCDFWLHVGWGHFPMSNSTTLIILKKKKENTVQLLSQSDTLMLTCVTVYECSGMNLTGPFPYICSHNGTNAPVILFPTSQDCKNGLRNQMLCEQPAIK